MNYCEERFEEEIDNVDLVVDAVGGETQERSFEILTEHGILAPLRREPSEDRADEYGVHGRQVGVQPNVNTLAEINAGDVNDQHNVPAWGGAGSSRRDRKRTRSQENRAANGYGGELSVVI